MISDAITITKLVTDLIGVGKANPDLRVYINRIESVSEKSGGIPFIVADVTLTNISTSPYSVSPLFLNDTEAILSPIIDTDEVGGRYIEKYEDDVETKYLNDESKLAHIKPLPDTPYLQPRESKRGLVFWEGDFSGKELKISTTILSENREISALIPLPTK